MAFDLNTQPELARADQVMLDDALGISPALSKQLNTIKLYIQEMTPGKAVSDAKGVDFTQRLYNAFMAIIGTNDVSMMVNGMDHILELYRAHGHGVLSTVNTQRFVDKWNISEDKRDLFSSLCYLFYKYSDVTKYNKELKKLQLSGDGGLLQNLLPAHQERLITYFKRYMA